MQPTDDGLTWVQRYELRHKEKKLCKSCPRRAAQGKTRCSVCLKKARKRAAQRRKEQKLGQNPSHNGA